MARWNKIECGDWHLGEGCGGYDKKGTLRRDKDGTYVWLGHSQGNWGMKWNLDVRLKFKVNGDEIEIIAQRGEHPIVSELLAGVKRLEEI